MSLQDFTIMEKLGSGAYSSVYKVRRIKDKQIYAIKKINYFHLSQKQQKNSLNQIRILASIRNQNIIGYKQTFFDSETKCLYIVMQFAENGDLYQNIKNRSIKKDYFDQEYIWKVFIHLVNGLKILHNKNILHRDLKSANIFLTNRDCAKLGDMNVSTISNSGLCKTQTGTPYYASPQVWKDQHYGVKSDIWSLGCVVYQMAALQPPFQADDMKGLYKKVTNCLYEKIPVQYSSDLNNIIRLLLQVDPYKRPSCDKILKMKIVLKRLIGRNSSINKVEQNPQFLETIRLPTQMSYFVSNLPPSNYFNPTVSQKYHVSAKRIQSHSKNFKTKSKLSNDKLRGLNNSVVIKNKNLFYSKHFNEGRNCTQQNHHVKARPADVSLPIIRKRVETVINTEQKIRSIKKIYRDPAQKNTK